MANFIHQIKGTICTWKHLQFNQQYRNSFMHCVFLHKSLCSRILPRLFKIHLMGLLYVLFGNALCYVWSSMWLSSYCIGFGKTTGLVGKIQKYKVSLTKCKDILSLSEPYAINVRFVLKSVWFRVAARQRRSLMLGMSWYLWYVSTGKTSLHDFCWQH